ncbi:hypothetical protein Daus18300_008206 [Diaporthe australafricana]|uniref:C2H2-type domain-containing protein n=1 Tax=Diaporthe australafricana TaxID=127596 RepID=A0ABR3WJA0_9PEZI
MEEIADAFDAFQEQTGAIFGQIVNRAAETFREMMKDENNVVGTSTQSAMKCLHDSGVYWPIPAEETLSSDLSQEIKCVLMEDTINADVMIMANSIAEKAASVYNRVKDSFIQNIGDNTNHDTSATNAQGEEATGGVSAVDHRMTEPGATSNEDNDGAPVYPKASGSNSASAEGQRYKVKRQQKQRKWMGDRPEDIWDDTLLYSMVRDEKSPQGYPAGYKCKLDGCNGFQGVWQGRKPHFMTKHPKEWEEFTGIPTFRYYCPVYGCDIESYLLKAIKSHLVNTHKIQDKLEIEQQPVLWS